MAKDKDKIYSEFLAEILTVVPEDKREAVKEAIEADPVKTKLRDSVLARAEFSSSMDALKAERTTFEKEVAEARQKIEGWQTWYGETSKQVAGIQDELKQYKDQFGDLTPEGKAAAKQAGLSEDEFNKRVAEEFRKRDLYNLKFADDLTDIKIDYKDRFHEKLPTDQVYKIAGEKNVDLPTAYNLFIADRVEDLRQKDVKAQIEQAKKDAVADFMTSHNIPIVPSTSDITHVLDYKNAPNTAADRIKAAVAGFTAGNK